MQIFAGAIATLFFKKKFRTAHRSRLRERFDVETVTSIVRFVTYLHSARANMPGSMWRESCTN